MTAKRKTNVPSGSKQRTLPLLLIGVGVLILVANAVFSIAYVTESEQIIDQVAGTIGETAGRVGQEIGTAAGNIGQDIGDTAGSLGVVVGETFGALGATLGHAMGSLWPLVLVMIGLGLIVRRPAEKGKNDDLDDSWSRESD